MATPQSGSVLSYRIGDITLDVARCRVRRGNNTLSLGKLTYELLLALAEAAPRVVKQEELVKRLWGGRYVSPDTIKQRVKLLRQSLEDDADDPRYIRVVRGQGYRLIPDVRQLTVASRPLAWKRPVFVALTITVIGLVLAIGTFWRGQDQSIAVLPFQDMSPNGDQEYFANGIAVELISELALLDGLRVAGRAFSFSFGQSDKDPQAIGEALDVNSILGGSIRKDGDRIRVTAELIDAATGSQIWFEVYDGDLTDIDLLIALNQGDRDALKAAMLALPVSSPAYTELYSPVLQVFDSPKIVLSTLQRIYRDANVQWLSKLHDIALLATFFGDHEFALRVKAEEVRNIRFVSSRSGIPSCPMSGACRGLSN